MTRLLAAAVVWTLALLGPPSAQALEVILKDVAPDRIERQRANARGHLPLADTPALGKLSDRLNAAGLQRGAHVFIRIFKEESELELWMAKDGRYIRFATYPICFWSGGLGPKLYEGDRQTPEGMYTVGRRQLRLIGRWSKSLNLWFPNAYDKANDRTGSYILIHGGCSSIGCYALTDDVLDEVHGLVRRAIRRGRQRLVHVHAFPFRMTDANLARHAGSVWSRFWRDLKVGYELFEQTRIPPQVGVCETRYVFAQAT
ncbi:MAG: murein L,D-transpeptidase family protein, partial [Pseudomonadota bacterium]